MLYILDPRRHQKHFIKSNLNSTHSSQSPLLWLQLIHIPSLWILRRGIHSSVERLDFTGLREPDYAYSFPSWERSCHASAVKLLIARRFRKLFFRICFGEIRLMCRCHCRWHFLHIFSHYHFTEVQATNADPFSPLPPPPLHTPSPYSLSSEYLEESENTSLLGRVIFAQDIADSDWLPHSTKNI